MTNVLSNATKMKDTVLDKIVQYKECADKLGMTNEVLSIEEEAQKLREGIFRVLFTGEFNAGKSALLNALMKKHLLKSSNKAETAVLTQIIFNSDEKVLVHLKNGKDEEYTVKEFFEKFSVDQARPDLFDNVDHVSIHRPESGLGDGLVQLIDSPGVGNSRQDDAVARGFAEKASAIVYMTPSIHAWSDESKRYIQEKYAFKELENVFFVINKMDMLETKEDIADLKKNTEVNLKNVFTRKDGTFNQELYNKRVFYISAQDYLWKRAGVPDNVIRKPDVNLIDEEGTGVPGFEEGLSKYLVDDNRDRSALAAFVPKMENVYNVVEHKVKVELELALVGIEDLIAKRDLMTKEKESLEVILKGVKDSFEIASTNILMKAIGAYENYVTAIEDGWEAYFKENPVPNVSVVGLIFDRVAHRDSQKRFEPIISGIREYVVAKLKTDLQPQIDDIVDYETRECEKRVSAYQQQLDGIEGIDIDEIICDFAKLEGYEVKVNGKTNLVQVIAAVITRDPELIVDGAFGRSTMREFISNLIKVTITETLGVYILEGLFGGWGILIHVIQRIIATIRHRESAQNEILGAMKSEIVDGMSSQKNKFMFDLEKKLVQSLIGASSKICKGIQNGIDEKLVKINELIEDIESNKFSYDKRKKEVHTTLHEMLGLIAEVRELTSVIE